MRKNTIIMKDLNSITATHTMQINFTVLPLFIPFFGNKPGFLKATSYNTFNKTSVLSMLNSLLSNPFKVNTNRGSESFQDSTIEYFVYKYKKVATLSECAPELSLSFIGVNSLPLEEENHFQLVYTSPQEWVNFYHQFKSYLTMNITSISDIKTFRSGMGLARKNQDEGHIRASRSINFSDEYMLLIHDFQNMYDWNLNPIEGFLRGMAGLSFLLMADLDFIEGKECQPGSLNYSSFQNAGFFEVYNCDNTHSFCIKDWHEYCLQNSSKPKITEIGQVVSLQCRTLVATLNMDKDCSWLLQELANRSENIHHQKKDSSSRSASSAIASVFEYIHSTMQRDGQSHETDSVANVFKHWLQCYDHTGPHNVTAQKPPFFNLCSYQEYLRNPTLYSMKKAIIEIGDQLADGTCPPFLLNVKNMVEDKDITPSVSRKVDPAEINKFVIFPIILRIVIGAFGNKNNWNENDILLVEFVLHHLTSTYKRATVEALRDDQIYKGIAGEDVTSVSNYVISSARFFVNAMEFACAYNEFPLLIRALSTAEAKIILNADKEKKMFYVYGMSLRNDMSPCPIAKQYIQPRC